MLFGSYRPKRQGLGTAMLTALAKAGCREWLKACAAGHQFKRCTITVEDLAEVMQTCPHDVRLLIEGYQECYGHLEQCLISPRKIRAQYWQRIVGRAKEVPTSTLLVRRCPKSQWTRFQGSDGCHGAKHVLMMVAACNT